MKLTVLTSAVHGLDAAHVELFRHIDNNGVCEVRGWQRQLCTAFFFFHPPLSLLRCS
jgi:hypothetical protein